MSPTIRLTKSNDNMSLTQIFELKVRFDSYFVSSKVHVVDEFLMQYDKTAEQDIIEKLVEEICYQEPWISYSWLINEVMNTVGFKYNTYSSKGSFESIGHIDANTIYSDANTIYSDANTIYSGDIQLSGDNNSTWENKARKLPGMQAIVVCPCSCDKGSLELISIIMHLNDKHSPGILDEVWTTEDVCNWLDELHDSGIVNLEIEIPDKEIK